MDSLSRYLQAVNPHKRCILGVKLNPFCVGHFLHLSKLGSPFVSEAAVSSITLKTLTDPQIWGEFVLALAVCSHDYESWQEMLNDSVKFSQEMRLLNKNIKESIKLLRKKKQFDPLETIILFREYLMEGFKVPAWSFTGSTKGTGTSSKHWSQQLIEDLVSKTNRTLSEVLNLHLAAAWLAWSHIAEDAGVIDLLNEEQTEALEHGDKTGQSGLVIEPGGWEKLLEYRKQQGMIL